MTPRLPSFAAKAACALISYATLVSMARAQLIFSDNFDRGTVGSPVALNGSLPDFSAPPERWTAPADIVTKGASATFTSATTGDAYIQVPSATANLIPGTYTLSVTLTQPGSYGTSFGNTFVGAGFGKDTSTTATPSLSPDLDAFFAIYQGNGQFAIFDTPSSTMASNLLDRINGLTGNAHVVLTLTVNSNGTDNFAASVNGTSLVLSQTSGVLIDATQVFLAQNNNTTSFEGFSLDGPRVVPEPQSWAMLLGGVGALLVAQRLRRKLNP